jgi:hypothetical protein
VGGFEQWQNHNPFIPRPEERMHAEELVASFAGMTTDVTQYVLIPIKLHQERIMRRDEMLTHTALREF